jgi:hypothetical protein
MDSSGVGPVLIGDESFIAKISGMQPRISQDNHVDEEGREHLQVTVDPEGNLIGDTSKLPANILEQLSTPESKAKMKAQHEAFHNGEKPRVSRVMRGQVDAPKPPRYLNEREDRRIFVDTKPPGMSTREWRKMGRKRLHKDRKAILKTQRSLHHERQSD